MENVNSVMRCWVIGVRFYSCLSCLSILNTSCAVSNYLVCYYLILLVSCCIPLLVAIYELWTIFTHLPNRPRRTQWFPRILFPQSIYHQSEVYFCNFSTPKSFLLFSQKIFLKIHLCVRGRII